MQANNGTKPVCFSLIRSKKKPKTKQATWTVPNVQHPTVITVKLGIIFGWNTHSQYILAQAWWLLETSLALIVLNCLIYQIENFLTVFACMYLVLTETNCPSAIFGCLLLALCNLLLMASKHYKMNRTNMELLFL